MKHLSLLAAMGGLVAAQGVPAMAPMAAAVPRISGYSHRGGGRFRGKGKPGKPGAKLARMASEGRIGTPRGVPA